MLAGREWFKLDGAGEESIRTLTDLAPFPLPESYLALLRFSNGGEGPLPVEPWNFCLDTAELVAEMEQTGAQKEFFPGLFVIGGNGGSEAIALDANAPAPHPVVMFDMTNCNFAESVSTLAEDFDAFLEMVGRSAD